MPIAKSKNSGIFSKNFHQNRQLPIYAQIHTLNYPQTKSNPTQNRIFFTPHSPFTIHYSLFTIHYSPFTIHYSPFTIHYSLFTIHYSPFTIHYSLFTIHHSPFTIHYSPLHPVCTHFLQLPIFSSAMPVPYTTACMASSQTCALTPI